MGASGRDFLTGQQGVWVPLTFPGSTVVPTCLWCKSAAPFHGICTYGPYVTLVGWLSELKSITVVLRVC